MQTFDEIYLLDLHGNSKKKQKTPDGGKDENVFDIQQGVAIGIFVKRQNTRKQAATLRHAELFGLREGKYQWLWEHDSAMTPWREIQPQEPFYLFVPQNTELLPEYERGWKVTDIFPVNSVGIVTSRDKLLIHFTLKEVEETLAEFARLPVEEARQRFDLGNDSRDWQVSLAQSDLRRSGVLTGKPATISYRPFDNRFTYYTGHSRGFHSMPRPAVMRQMAGNNLALLTSRMTKGEAFAHAFVTLGISEKIYLSPKTSNNSFHFPLYLFPGESDLLVGDRHPNLAPGFVAALSQRLGMVFVADREGDRVATVGPEDVFFYAYTVLHSPEYRRRYAEFLKIDFPRLPLTSDPELFRALCVIGKRLTGLHLMEETAPLLTRFPVAGDNRVESVRFTESATDGTPGRVWINGTQYFDGIPPEVWNFHIGGYQVCHKWLKDRKGRQLSYDDMTHYQRVVASLAETLRLQAAIDQTIGAWPLQ